MPTEVKAGSQGGYIGTSKIVHDSTNRRNSNKLYQRTKIFSHCTKVNCVQVRKIIKKLLQSVVHEKPMN